jgi:hypothetical protein
MCKAFPANKTGGVNILTGLAYVSNLQTRKVIAEGEERGNQWAVVRCEDKLLYSGRATDRFVIADIYKAMTAGGGCGTSSASPCCLA